MSLFPLSLNLFLNSQLWPHTNDGITLRNNLAIQLPISLVIGKSIDHSYQQSSMLLPGPVVTRYVVGPHIYFPRMMFGVSLLYTEHDRMLATKVPPS